MASARAVAPGSSRTGTRRSRGERRPGAQRKGDSALHVVSRDHCRHRLAPEHCQSCLGPTLAGLSRLSSCRWSIRGSHSQPKPQRVPQALLELAAAMAVGIRVHSKPTPARLAGSSACSPPGKQAEESPHVESEIHKSSPDIRESRAPAQLEHLALPRASKLAAGSSSFASSSFLP